MSTDGGHLGWSFGSLDIILKVDHLRTIHAMFALNWLTDSSNRRIKKYINALRIDSAISELRISWYHT
jgi:hypothetical protein